MNPQHVSGVFTPIVRRSDCLLLPMVSCPVIVVMMLESRVVRCVHCDGDVACNILVTVSIKCAVPHIVTTD
jgi:hypothetical protein